MKYIMLDTSVKGSDLIRKIPIIFPDYIVHRDVAEVMEKLLREKYNWEVKIISAGDIDLLTGAVSGKSDTLKMHAATEDEGIIAMYQYQHGII